MLILLLVCQVSIAQKKKKKSSVGPTGETIEISTLELRLTMDDFFNRFSRTITESADSIIRLSKDYNIDNQALFWKMNAIPVAQGAIYSKDPFAAFIDMAVFNYQMKIYYEKGNGKDLFGEFQDIAIGASDALYKDLMEIARNLTPGRDISEGIKLVEEFAEQNPINSSYFIRRSTLPLMLSIQEVEKVSFKSLAEGMAQSLDELSTRINAYTEILPKQVRWQAEYLLNNALTNPELTGRLDSLTYLLERSVLVVESSPELIDQQRSTLMQELRGERIAVLQAIRQERIAVLDEIRKERTIVMQLLSDEITLQREASFQELNSLTGQSIDLSFNNLENIVDTIFWRTVVLLFIFLVVLVIGIIIYKRT
ncbi:hypothetical protein [uncultured Eudoraea sp.]|uniref:hypothetical protein n=1 Tax=uncultured Eudoraea sp. TaxID=1035614 RepID=UPI00261E3336|nr:hypothetical protein [uncultured Eudoraea sp.]